MRNSKDYTFIDVEKLMTPFDGAVVLMDHWWVVIHDQVLLFRGITYQCNLVEDFTRRMGVRLYGEDIEIRHIPVAYTRALHE